jgi:uncharacterized membrane protein
MSRIETFFGRVEINFFARIGLAAGLVAMGLLSLMTGHPALQGHTWLDASALLPLAAKLAGVLSIASGIMMLMPVSVARGSRYAGFFILVWIATISLPTSLTYPSNIAAWLGPAELFVIAMGLGVLGLQDQGHGGTWLRWRDRISIVLATCFILFGISHFAYLDFTGGMIPPFLPFHTELAAITGAMHIVIGLGLLVSRTARLAIAVGAAMMSSFVLLVHVPGVISSKGDPDQLVMLVKALLLSSAAWMLTYRWNQSGEPLP